MIKKEKNGKTNIKPLRGDNIGFSFYINGYFYSFNNKYVTYNIFKNKN